MKCYWEKFPEGNRNSIPYKGDIAAARFLEGKLVGYVWRLGKSSNFNFLNYLHLTHWMPYSKYKELIESLLKPEA